jgi:RimJ/RimL family protein N-acetyltransferase
MTDPFASPVLATSRLILRPFTLDDAPTVQALLASPEISETTQNISYPYPDGAAAQWISGHQAAAEAGFSLSWAVVRETDSTLMGTIALGLNRQNQRGTLGYWLGVPYWNHGYMSEAATAVTEWAFEALHLNRVEAMCLPRNPASARVMEKAGLKYEGILRGYIRKDEHFEDLAIYARLASD